MATLTKITKTRRRLRRARMGADRKKLAERDGTTISFPIHTPEIDAAAPAAQVSPKKDSDAS
jgi:hypothetical protein